jgi:hypothetical protein
MTIMTVAGHRFNLDPATVEQAVEGELPEPIKEHFVVINGRRWPPKQVLALVTGLDKADFTTHQARRALTRLGFSAARRARARESGNSAQRRPLRGIQGSGPLVSHPSAEVLRPYTGQFVAVRGDEVLVAAPTLPQVLTWLTRHHQRATSVFGVPAPGQEVTGAAPQ